MVYIFTEPKVTMDVDMIAERIMQMIGFLFLNNASDTSKQNNVCTIQMAYRIFLLDLFFKRLFSNIHNPISRMRIPI